MKFTKLDVYYVALEASSQHMNGVYFYPSSACVCRPHQGGSDRPCRAPRRKVLQSRGVCYYPPSRQVQPTAVWRQREGGFCSTIKD